MGVEKRAKRDIARVQIEAAVVHYEAGEFIPAITLAGAGERILARMATNLATKDSALRETKKPRQSDRSDQRGSVGSVRGAPECWQEGAAGARDGRGASGPRLERGYERRASAGARSGPPGSLLNVRLWHLTTNATGMCHCDREGDPVRRSTGPPISPTPPEYCSGISRHALLGVLL